MHAKIIFLCLINRTNKYNSRVNRSWEINYDEYKFCNSTLKSYTITNRNNNRINCLLWYWHAAFMFIAVRALCMIKRDYLKMIKIKPKRLMYFLVLNIFWLNKKKFNNIRQLFCTLRKSLFFILRPKCFTTLLRFLI